jgi:hypothetical protein
MVGVCHQSKEENVMKITTRLNAKFLALTAAAVCSFCGSEAFGQMFQMRLVSSAYGWQQQDSAGQSSRHLFGYQTAQISISEEQLSFHTYLQGFNDFSGPLQNKGEIRAYNFYLKYAGLFNAADVSVGRIPVFSGVGVGSLDGGIASVRLFDTQVKLTGYGGLLPEEDDKFDLIGDKRHNTMFGGQISAVPFEWGAFSISYMRKNELPESYWAERAHDSTYAIQNVEITSSPAAEEYISGDANIDYDWFSASLRYDYDILQDQMSREQVFTRFRICAPVSLTAEYIQREPLLEYNSIFWVFAYNTLIEYDAGVEYAVDKNIQVYGRYGSVSYGDGETSDRVTIGGNTKYVSANIAWNTGYGGQLAAVSANAGYPLLNNMLTPTLLLSYAHYRLESTESLTDALSIGAGIVYRPVPLLSVETQVQWLTNSIYSNDLRLFVRASYFFSHQLNIF